MITSNYKRSINPVLQKNCSFLTLIHEELSKFGSSVRPTSVMLFFIMYVTAFLTGGTHMLTPVPFSNELNENPSAEISVKALQEKIFFIMEW